MHVEDAGIIWNADTKEFLVGEWDQIKERTKEYPRSFSFNRYPGKNSNFKNTIFMYSVIEMLIIDVGIDGKSLNQALMQIAEYQITAQATLTNIRTHDLQDRFLLTKEDSIDSVISMIP